MTNFCMKKSAKSGQRRQEHVAGLQQALAGRLTRSARAAGSHPLYELGAPQTLSNITASQPKRRQRKGVKSVAEMIQVCRLLLLEDYSIDKGSIQTSRKSTMVQS
jgi:hypothetical protein